jgi:hypothetical protein
MLFDVNLCLAPLARWCLDGDTRDAESQVISTSKHCHTTRFRVGDHVGEHFVVGSLVLAQMRKVLVDIGVAHWRIAILKATQVILILVTRQFVDARFAINFQLSNTQSGHCITHAFANM